MRRRRPKQQHPVASKQHLPAGFPAGVRRVVDVPVEDQQPFFLGQVVTVDDRALDVRVRLVAVGYEIGPTTMTWYLGEPILDWTQTRAMLLRRLDARSMPVDQATLGAVIRTISVPITAMGDHPLLFAGAVVQVGHSPAVVGSYVIRGDLVEFLLRERRGATRDTDVHLTS